MTVNTTLDALDVGGSSNTIDRCYMNNPSGYAAQLTSTARKNIISNSTMTSNTASLYRVRIVGGL